MALDVPREVLAVGERRDRPRIEHSARRGIDHVDPLGTAGRVPVDSVEAHGVGLTVGQVESIVNCEPYQQAAIRSVAGGEPFWKARGSWVSLAQMLLLWPLNATVA